MLVCVLQNLEKYRFMDRFFSFLSRKKSVFVSPAKQKRDICTAFPASSLSSSSSAA